MRGKIVELDHLLAEATDTRARCDTLYDTYFARLIDCKASGHGWIGQARYAGDDSLGHVRWDRPNAVGIVQGRRMGYTSLTCIAQDQDITAEGFDVGAMAAVKPTYEDIGSITLQCSKGVRMGSREDLNLQFGGTLDVVMKRRGSEKTWANTSPTT